jgi:hypothetical protein
MIAAVVVRFVEKKENRRKDGECTLSVVGTMLLLARWR